LPGNHDEPRALRRELSGAPFVLGGHVDMGRWRIVLLDSCLPGSASGALSAQTLAELDEALGTAAGRHCPLGCAGAPCVAPLHAKLIH
jgi:Icc protein